MNGLCDGALACGFVLSDFGFRLGVDFGFRLSAKSRPRNSQLDARVATFEGSVHEKSSSFLRWPEGHGGYRANYNALHMGIHLALEIFVPRTTLRIYLAIAFF